MTSPFTAESGAPLDGEAVTDESATMPEEGGAPQDPSGLDGGWWLTHPDGKQVRQQLLAEWKRQDAPEKIRAAKERRNEYWRQGLRGAQIVQNEDEDTYDVRVPFGAATAIKAPNKADQLLRRIVATLTVDPPAPDVTPNSDDDQERAASQLAERLVKVEGSAANRDDVSLLRRALDLAATYGSVFVHTVWHPQQGGLKPLTIQAHPAAQTAEDALVVTTEAPDPVTGEVIASQAPADPASLIDRYVRLDGSLSDSPADAQMTWRGDVVERLCLPSQVRLLPITCDSDLDADGAIVGEVLTLADVIAIAYNGERPDEEVCKKLCGHKLTGWESWVPRANRAALGGDPPRRPDGTLSDDAPVTCMTLYYTSSSGAPFGCRVMICGGVEEPCLREEMRVTLGQDTDAPRPVFLPLPVAQFRWAEDTATGDYKGIAGIEWLSAMEEIRASALKYQLEYMHNYGSPQTYLPVDSILQEENYMRRDGTPKRVNPGSTPFFEPTPPMSPVPEKLYAGMGEEMNTASGLEEAAQGVASGSVQSGIHAQQIIEQALVALSGQKQNADKGLCRVWRNRVEWYRAFTDVPRQMEYLGEAGDMQVRAFTGVDLIGAGDVSIARGTGTMLPKSAKTAIAREELQMATTMGDTLAATRYYKSIAGNTGPTLGLQDDPHRARISRQIALWKDGATKQHEAAPAQEPMEPQFDDMGNEVPQAPAPDPVADEAAQLFLPNPTDDLPDIAPMRFRELADVMASRAFLSADPRYQQALVMEYERMRQAAGVMTLVEQQQAQAQQQQLMQQEAIETENAKQASKTAYAEKEGGPAADRMAMQTAASQIGPPQEQLQ